jgi:hypothetical protein
MEEDHVGSMLKSMVAMIAKDVYRGQVSVTSKVPKAPKAHHMMGTMRWVPLISTFMLDKMCELIKGGARTNKGFKEVHLIAMVKALFEHCGVEVRSTQLYNHLGKWRILWLQVLETLVEHSGSRTLARSCSR